MIKRFFFVFLSAFLLFSCKKEYACWCTAVVTVDGVTTAHKYKKGVVSKTRRDGKKKCAKLARNTEFSEINCALYDY